MKDNKAYIITICVLVVLLIGAGIMILGLSKDKKEKEDKLKANEKEIATLRQQMQEKCPNSRPPQQ